MKLSRARELATANRSQSKELAHLLDRIAQTPATHTIKGMYVAGLDQALRSLGVERDAASVQAFKDYPLRDFMELLLDASATLHSSGTVDEGLRRLGELAIPTFAKSIIGRVIMGTVGRSWELALKCVSRGYEVSLTPGKATVVELEHTTALVELRNVWNFPESYQVGVVTGLLRWCNLEGRITPRVISRCDVDLRIEWQPERFAGRRRSRPPQGVARP